LTLDVGRAHHAPVALPQERDLVSGVQESGWALGLLLTCVDNLTHLGHGQWNREKSFGII